MKDKLMLVAVGAFAAVAATGWMRQPVQPQVPVSSFQAPADAQPAAPVPVRTQQRAIPVKRVSFQDDANEPQLKQRSPDANAAPARNPEYTAPVQRSKNKSIAIVAGSAAAGAAIGGLAGGGKGAAIGAITGGAGGYIYDRMTHKKNDGYGWKNENRVP